MIGYRLIFLTHWGRVTHICVGNLTIIGSDNGLSPGRRQAIIWINAGILLTGPLGTNFSEIIIEIDTFSLKKMHLKMSSGKWRPFCLGLNVLMGNSLLGKIVTLSKKITLRIGISMIEMSWSGPSYICNGNTRAFTGKWEESVSILCHIPHYSLPVKLVNVVWWALIISAEL